MPRFIENTYRGDGIDVNAPDPIFDPNGVKHLLTMCPAHAETSLVSYDGIADAVGVSELFIKDESDRMGLGSFKALGAAHAIAREAAEAVQDNNWSTALQGRTYVTASAGNHGLSVAAGARLFGAEAVVYLSATVPDAFAEKLQAKRARVVREGKNYEASMAAAETAADKHGWTLLSDSAWDGYVDLPLRVMEGYLQLAVEAVVQMGTPATHVLLQAGVGGFAASIAAYLRHVWGDAPKIIVVEPEVAPALYESIKAGSVVTTEGKVSGMGRLDCKTPSIIGLKGLSRDADLFVTISEQEAESGVEILAEHDLPTTPSGAAGVAALAAGLKLPKDARVLAFVTEGPEDA